MQSIEFAVIRSGEDPWPSIENIFLLSTLDCSVMILYNKVRTSLAQTSPKGASCRASIRDDRKNEEGMDRGS